MAAVPQKQLSARRSARGSSERVRRRPARGRLLEAARQLAPIHGYESIRVGELAKAAKVSRETFYTHFADKRECVAEACEPRLANIERELRAAAGDGHGWAMPLLRAVDETLADLYGSAEGPRGRLTAAMLESVGQSGFSRTRISQVIKAAHVSQSHFYALFASKRDCFAATCAELIAEIEEEVMLGLQLHPQATPEVALALLLDRISRDGLTARVLLVEIAALPSTGDDPALAYSHSFAEMVDRLLFGLDPGGLGPLRRVATGSVVEAMRSAVLAEELEDLPAQADELAALLTTITGGRGARKREARLSLAS